MEYQALQMNVSLTSPPLFAVKPSCRHQKHHKKIPLRSDLSRELGHAGEDPPARLNRILRKDTQTFGELKGSIEYHYQTERVRMVKTVVDMSQMWKRIHPHAYCHDRTDSQAFIRNPAPKSTEEGCKQGQVVMKYYRHWH